MLEGLSHESESQGRLWHVLLHTFCRPRLHQVASAGMLLVAGVLPASCQASGRRSFLAFVGPLFARIRQASQSRGLGCSVQEVCGMAATGSMLVEITSSLEYEPRKNPSQVSCIVHPIVPATSKNTRLTVWKHSEIRNANCRIRNST